MKWIVKLLWLCIPLFRLWGVPVRMHVSVLLFPTSLILIAGWMEDRWAGMLFCLGFLVILYGSILVHEFAHVAVATRCGIPTWEVILLPIGCVALLEDMPREPHELGIALAGPLASLILGGCLWLVGTALGSIPTKGLQEIRAVLTALCLFNCFTGLFNLLPCFPMDGGRVLRSALAVTIGLVFPRHAHRAFLIATRIAVRYVTRPMVLILLGIVLLLTHTWGHLLVVGFLVLAGELELVCLESLPEFSRAPLIIAIQPAFGRRSTPAPRGSELRPARTLELVIYPPRTAAPETA
jgi:Zn-dependent protease